MFELMQKGGPVMWLHLAASLIAAAVFLERLFHLHRAQIKADDFLKGIYNILKRRNIVEAVSICEETPGPVAHIVRAAVLHHDEPMEDVALAVEEAGLSEIPRLERRLSLLATIAQVAPLIGLLGTVLGMMQVLVVLQQQAPLVHQGDLSAGLLQALLSTAAGLAIAIPAYVGYNFLLGRVEAIVLDMERTSVEILAFMAGQNHRAEKHAG
ncbi:MAG: MotA/TolQ/ExbB proton channel family protein [Kiritimatiellae bacterium]|nr:MotA/TolQ/ExbB proton channel family protein [Kiritimatiellia bacterium]